MANPWDNDPIVGKVAGPVYGAPPKVEPFAARDQEIQEGQFGLSRQNAQRDAARFERDVAKEPLDRLAKETTIQDSTINNETSMRAEFQARPIVKAFEEVLPKFVAATRAADNPVGDMQVITAWVKAYDPTGSIMAGDVATAEEAQSAVQKMTGNKAALFEGNGRLRPEVRQNFLREIHNRLTPMADAYRNERAKYVDIAKRTPGVNPENIVGTPFQQQFQDEEAAYLGRPIRNLDGSQGASPPAAGGGVESANLEPGEFMRDGTRWFKDPKTGEETPVLVGGSVGSPAQLDAAQIAAAEGPAGASDLFKSGAMLGLDDEASGVGNMLANAFTSPFTDTNFDPGRAYTAGRDAQRMRIKQARQQQGLGGTALEIGGSLMSGNVSNALAIAPSLLGRMGQGARAGMVGGGIGGFGYGEGAQNSLGSMAAGAGLGAGFGAALPVAGQVIGNRVDGIRRLTGRDPALPRRLVNEALEADATGPAAAGQMMDEAAQRGSPMMLADTGENARELLASVGRQPGPSRTITREALQGRQNAQAERISDAVVRDLGPTANIDELSEELITRARTESRPFYEAFEAAPGASVVKLDDIASRPAFRSALKKAVSLSEEMGDDPTALGFRFDAAGEMVLDRDALSWRAMDYVKQSLDDVIEASVDQRGNLTNAGRAALGTKKTLVARMDNVNPDYAKARAAYAGPAATRDAVEKGVKALNKSPDNITAEMRRMGEAEQEGYRLGIRKAIVELVNNKRDGGDKVAHLLGTPNSRRALSQVFGGRREFDRFIATLRDEEAMGRTYKAAYGNSQTAARTAQDATTNDGGLAEGAMDSVLRGQTLWGSAVAAFQKLRDVERFGAGESGQRARESVAALLSETDPETLRDLIAAAREASRNQAAMTGRRSRRAARVGRDVGVTTGGSIGSFSGPRQ